MCSGIRADFTKEAIKNYTFLHRVFVLASTWEGQPDGALLFSPVTC